MQIYSSASEAIQRLHSNQRVFIQGAAATPLPLVAEMENQASRLKNIELIHLHTSGPANYANPEFASSFRVVNLFVGENIRKKLDHDRVDYLPCFLSEIPALFRRNIRAPDVALIQVSKPDKDGNCSLGTSVDVTKAAVDTAKIVIAQINPNMPRTYGDSMIHESKITAAFELSTSLPETLLPEIDPVSKTIGDFVASLIDDGSTLQTGIGAIPNAALASLAHLKNLGVHTEMFSDGVMHLMQKGIINNHEKAIKPGKILTGFISGSKALYDFVHENKEIYFAESDFVNSTRNIAKNNKMIAINSAVEVDLSGQICADSIGHKIISGVGGQMDFIRGATLSEGGKAIIALPSTTKRGESRIVFELKPGAGVVTTRAHVHYVITEFGIADLYGKTLSERAKALIAIAHPKFREDLEKQWKA